MLFILTLLLSIIFYTQKNKLQDQRVAAEQELKKFVATNERNDKMMQAILAEASGDQTVFGSLKSKIERLRRVAAGDSSTTYDAIVADMKTMGLAEGSLASDTGSVTVTNSLLGEIRRLKENYDAERDRVNNLEGQREELRRELEEANKRRAELAQTFDSAQSDLKSRLANIQGDYNSFRRQAESTISGLEGKLESVRNENKDRINELNSQVSQLEQELEITKRKLESTQIAQGSATVESRPLAPDGQVVSLLSEEGMAYINRGREDRITLGMTFEVFNPNAIVELTEFDELRGKATLEVISVSDRSAVGRVVRKKEGVTVNEGDNIINLVYDPEATFKFFVHGDFDIDRDEVITNTERRRLEAMIEGWGGKLVSDLTYDVDYLLLGIEPELPEKPTGDIPDPVKLREYIHAKKKYDRYQELLKQAQQLSVPVLNQNRFLALIGYYQR
ncbi:MAG: BRCT domain-containing protein [Phycisphaeraceae bacterium]|nr:BRCT domain-containing protein [Phycisphaeraceae bacterium]